MDATELAPGLWRWTAPHPDWRPGATAGSSSDWPQEVGCALLQSDAAAVFIDALPSAEESEFWRWADACCEQRDVHVLTTIEFHRRARDMLVERYGARVSKRSAELPSGVVAFPLRGAGETVFWLPEQRTLVPGDRIIGAAGGGLRICPQSWLDYLPRKLTVAELRELLLPLLELPIERVLVSHGEPALSDGHSALADALG